MGSAVIRTKLGSVFLAWSRSGFTELRFKGDAPESSKAAPMWALEGMGRISAHLNGHPQDLSHIPVDLAGLTPFQRRIAELLRSTAPGQLVSYGELALLAGRPGAARAVGQAVKRNPLLLLVPCHRVVGAEGPGGWSAFGSPEIKAELLDLEARIMGNDDAPAAR